MDEHHDGPTGLHVAEVGGEPLQGAGVQVAHVAGAVPEHVVQDDVVDGAPLERVPGRPEMPLEGPGRVLVRGGIEVQVVVPDDLEERDPHGRDGALVVGEEGQVVVHDVPARHAEDRYLQPRHRPAHVRHRLVVEAVHLPGRLRLGVGEQQEGVAVVGLRERLEVEHRAHLAAPHRERSVQARRPRGGHRDPIAGRQREGEPAAVAGGKELEAAVGVGGGRGQAITDHRPGDTPASGPHASPDPEDRPVAVDGGPERSGQRGDDPGGGGPAEEGPSVDRAPGVGDQERLRASRPPGSPRASGGPPASSRLRGSTVTPP